MRDIVSPLDGIRSPFGQRRAFDPRYLFSAGEVGAWYDFSDLSTMFQDAAGTTPVTAVEQPVGLVLDKSRNMTLGSELFSSFATVNSPWTASGSGSWSINGSQGSNTDLISSSFYTTGTFYVTTFTLSGVSGGTVTVFAGEGSGVSLGNGTYTYRRYATQAYFLFRAAAGVSATVSNVSVKVMAGNHASQTTSTSRPVLSARVNLLTYTEQFDNAAWGKASGTSVSANTTTAPDGTLTADTITSVSGGEITQSITGVNGVTYRASLSFAKTSGATVFPMLAVNGSAVFGQVIINTNTGVAAIRSGVPGATSVTVTDQNTFWRLAFNLTIDTTSIAVKVYPAASTDGTSFTGGLSGSCVAWGADLRPANAGVGLPAYQRVGAATDYDTTGFPLYLKFDGTDDFLVSGSDHPFTYTGAVSLFAGFRKIGTTKQYETLFACGVVGNSTTNSQKAMGFQVTDNGNNRLATDIWSPAGIRGSTTLTSPVNGVAAFNIANWSTHRSSGAAVTLNGVAETIVTYGTFNPISLNTSKMYIGVFDPAPGVLPSSFFTGNIYGLIARNAQSTAAEVANTSTWLNGKTGAY